SDDRVEADAFATSLARSVQGYGVTESVPHWVVDLEGNGPPDAVKAVTLMHPAPGTGRDDLLRHWLDVHMPMSLRLQPHWSYVRNVVVPSLYGETPAPVAIAEQGFAAPDEIVDAHRFYGALDDASLDANRSAILADVPKFLDTTTTTTYVTQEHVLRR